VDGTATEDELRRRLDRHPADRYPVQHATARFHLGVALAGTGRLEEAEEHLATACRLFPADGMPAEHAKAANARGAVLRLLGRPADAAETFADAAARFERAGLALEQGAAVFNLGLAERELGGDGVEDAFRRARALLDPNRVPAQAGAAARELGAALLAVGRLDEAVECLRDAVELAGRAGDAPGLAGAANVLGVAHLALGNAGAAAASLEQSVAASPRSVRPDGYAMAKANLALADEARGRTTQARLAAQQALGTPGAPAPVRAQAADVLARLGDEPGAVWAVLDDLPPERWPAVVREELARWVDTGAARRAAEAAAWVHGQSRRQAAAEDLAEALLGALVELPPQAMETVIDGVVAAVAADGAEAFVQQCSRAMARFAVPQWMRLRDHFERASADAGLDAAW
jgi:tetratricopeptide (TPR) repeat protein